MQTLDSVFTGVGIAVEAGSSTVRVHVRIVADTFALRRPHLTQVRRRLHVPTVCSIRRNIDVKKRSDKKTLKT